MGREPGVSGEACGAGGSFSLWWCIASESPGNKKREEEMPGGEIVPVGDKEKAPSALAIGLADQQKLYAQRYEELDDEISDGVTETVPTDRLKHMFSDEPNWMVDGITGACGERARERVYLCLYPPRAAATRQS